MNKLKRVLARLTWIDLALLVPAIVGIIVGGARV